MRLYIIAGEASGDLHAGKLMEAVYRKTPDAVIRYRGGERMEKARQDYSSHISEDEGLAFDYRGGAVMGFFELLGKAGKLVSDIAACKKDILRFNPDAVILVDYPGFNLRIARWAHNNGFKVVYYIAPKVWASREGRIRQLRRYVDLLLTVFPFERDYFNRKGLPYYYCGNPLVEEIDESPALKCSRDSLKASFGADNTRLVAFLAGSRMGEIKTMMPLIGATAALIREDPEFSDCRFMIAGAPGRKESDYGEFDRNLLSIEFGRTREILRAADAALINSGTASLEAVLLGTPQVVAYKVQSALTYYLAKWFLLKAKYISLGNLCIDRLAFKECYLHENCNPETLSEELKRLLRDEKYRTAMLEDYSIIRKSLGGTGASSRAADAIFSLCDKTAH